MAKAYSFLLFSRQDPGRLSSATTEYCARRNLQLDTRLRFQGANPAGVRAKGTAPAALEDFLERVHSGEVSPGSTLLLDGFDAFTRPAATRAAKLLERIVAENITVVTPADGVECTRSTLKRDPAALLYAVVDLMRTSEERAAKSGGARASWKARRERAQAREPISAICPAWLELDAQTETFFVRRDRARVVQRIYRDALRGMGQAQIAESLNRDGVKVFGSGTRWHRSYVLKLLGSAAVLGTYSPQTMELVEGKRVRRPAGRPIRDYFPRIIEPDLFRQVQTLVRESRSPLRGRHASSGKGVNLFGGLARCGRCGAPVTMVSKGNAPRVVRYLVCSAARVNAGCRHYEAIRYDRFEHTLLRESRPLFSKAPSGERRAHLDRLIAEVDANTSGIGDELERLVSGAKRGTLSASAAVRVRELKAQREKLRLMAESLRAERETTSATYVRDRVAELRQALAAKPLDRTRVNALLRQVFSSVTVDYDGADLAFQWRHGGQSEVDLGS